MKRTYTALIATSVALLSVGAATSQSAPSPASGDITASADPNPVVYGQSTTVSGRLKSTPLKSGVLVRLQELPAPYTGGWQDVGTATTAANGTYEFTGVSPTESTKYRSLTAVPQSQSKDVLVPVAIKVVLRLSDRTPRRGQRVRFSGTAAPEHDGRLVYIQRQSFTSRWRTVGKTGLRDSGTELSSFSRRIRVRRDGTYRARVFHDSDHADGTSRPKRAFVH